MKAQSTRQGIEATMKAGLMWMNINPWCGLCGSTKLHFEDAETPFGSLAEAESKLRICEAAQSLTREVAAQLPKPN
jgi:hypothetical protein